MQHHNRRTKPKMTIVGKCRTDFGGPVEEDGKAGLYCR